MFAKTLAANCQPSLRLNHLRKRPRANICRAEEDRRGFDEGAAQVRRLVQRDSKSFDALLKSEYAEEEADGEVQKAGESETPTSDEKATPPEGIASSPFGSTPTSSPFGAPKSVSGPFGQGTVPKPMNEPEGLSPNMAPAPYEAEEAPWWSIFTSITLTQVVLAISFTLILSLMFVTFSVVFNAGGIHFNE